MSEKRYPRVRVVSINLVKQKTEKRYFIYLCRNKVNGQVYIGKTKNAVNSRWEQHCRSAAVKKCKTYFYNAIRKHGSSVFEVSIIDVARTNEEANRKERKWIRIYRSNESNFGYNMTEGGDGISEMSDEVKKKISITTKKAMRSEEIREKLRKSNFKFWHSPEGLEMREHFQEIGSGENASMYGKHHTPETRQRMSESRKAYFADMTEEEYAGYKSKASIGQLNRIAAMTDEEHEQKFSVAQRKRYEQMTPTERKVEHDKRSAATIKHFESPAAREKTSLGVKKYFESPEARERLSKVMTGKRHTPETIEKMLVTRNTPEYKKKLKASIKRMWIRKRAEKLAKAA